MKVINDYIKRMNEARKEIASIETQIDALMNNGGTISDYNTLVAKKYIAMNNLAGIAEDFSRFMSSNLGDEMDVMNPGAKQLVALHFANS